MDIRWLAWTRRIQSIAQAGLTYTEGMFDRERYRELQEIAAEMMATGAGAEPERVLSRQEEALRWYATLVGGDSAGELAFRAGIIGSDR